MKSGKFRAPVRALGVVAALAFAAGMLAILAPTAAGKPPSCRVSNAATHQSYNSLQAALNRRFGRGWGMGVSYTFSKALGTASGLFDQVNPYFNLRSRNYGPVTFDRTHVCANIKISLPVLPIAHAPTALGLKHRLCLILPVRCSANSEGN